MNVTINEGSGGDLKELIETQKQLLASSEASRELLVGIASFIVKAFKGDEESEGLAAIPPDVLNPKPSPTVGRPAAPIPPIPPPVFVELPAEEALPQAEPKEKIVYSEDFASNEESGIIFQSDEQRVQIDMEAELRAAGIEIDNASIPFPAEDHMVGEV